MMSMTGHGSGAAALSVDGKEEGRVTVELRAVNHRGFEVRVRLSSALGEHATALEEVVRRRLDRGRVILSAELEGGPLAPLCLDREKARCALSELAALRDEVAPGEPLPLSLLAAVPDLFGAPRELPSAPCRAALLEATEAACAELMAMRAREGEGLRRDFEARRATLSRLLEEVAERYPASVEAYRERLRERIERVLALADKEVALDPGRLEQEVVLFADRADIAEELTRLRTHLAHFAELEASADEGKKDGVERVGRRLDFLLQEMSRETNTIGAKSADAAIAAKVVQMKAEIARMREQAQNVL